MDVGKLLNVLFFCFAVLGALDYLFDNRFGIGKEFERGIKCAGTLVLCMVGFMTVAPAAGRALAPVITPFFERIGADPSLFAGILLSIDSGGAVTAKEMALSEEAYVMNGYFVAAMFGSALNGNISLSVAVIRPERRRLVLFGLAIGIISIPFGCLVGGILAGLSAKTIFGNLIPLFILSLVLTSSIILFSKALEKILKVFGKGMVLICLLGILICAARELCGFRIPVEGQSFEEIMVIIGKIVLCLCGVFPLLGILLKLVKKPIGRLAERTGTSVLDINCLIMDLVNCFSSIDLLNEMTDTGILLNCAVGVGAGYALGDHFAYVTATEPRLTIPLILAKLSAGAFSVIAVALLARFITGKKRGDNIAREQSVMTEGGN